jgi:hypothetical protein
MQLGGQQNIPLGSGNPGRGRRRRLSHRRPTYLYVQRWPASLLGAVSLMAGQPRGRGRGLDRVRERDPASARWWIWMSSIDKTVAAPTALAALDQARHNIIYRPDPTVGVRGIHHAIVTTLGGEPAHGSAVPSAHASDLPATKHAERGRAAAAEPPALPTATGGSAGGPARAAVGIVAVQPSYRTAGAARNPPAGSGRLAAGQVCLAPGWLLVVRAA